MANWAPAGKVKGLFPVRETIAPAQMPPLPPPLRTQGGVTPPINLFTSKDAVGVPSSEASPSKRVNQKLNMTKSTLRILGAVAFLVVGGAGISLINSLMKAGISNFTKPEAGLKTPILNDQIVTFEEYNKIANGASYTQVVEIIGSEGEERSRNEIDGIPGVMDPIETIMYEWVNENGSNMNALFQNNKLGSKAQFGLK